MLPRKRIPKLFPADRIHPVPVLARGQQHAEVVPGSAEIVRSLVAQRDLDRAPKVGAKAQRLCFLEAESRPATAGGKRGGASG